VFVISREKTQKGATPEMKQQAINPFWNEFDNLIWRSCRIAERATRITFSINIVMVGAGIALLAYSMIYSWVNSLDIYSTGFGALGVATFVSIFFLSPQSKIAESSGDLAQLQMLYRTYIYQTDLIQGRARARWDAGTFGNMDLKEIEETSKLLEETTNNIVQKIEILMGGKTPKPAGSTPASTPSSSPAPKAAEKKIATDKPENQK
jgi:hypothetical protein